MKQILSIIGLTFFFINMQSQHHICMDSLKADYTKFVYSIEPGVSGEIDAISSVTFKSLNSNEVGMFRLVFLNGPVHAYAHFLLLDDDDYSFLNMRDPFEDNFELLSSFLEENKSIFTEEEKDDFYHDLLRVHRNNTNYLKYRDQEKSFYETEEILFDDNFDSYRKRHIPSDGYIHNKDMATKIAVVVIKDIFKYRRNDVERWSFSDAQLKDGIWNVTGQVRFGGDINELIKFHVAIRKDNGEIIEVTSDQ